MLNTVIRLADTVTIGTALPAGNNLIGRVDVNSLPSVTLASQANPFTTAIPVSDNGGSLTVDGTVAISNSSFGATQSGIWDIRNISGTISLPTGAATETTLASLNSKITAVNTGAVVISSGTVSVSNSSFGATQSGTWNITNVSGTISLPTGASTSALQTSGNSSLSSIDSKTPALGQALASASVPVVLTAAQLSTLTPPAAITGFALESSLSSLNAKVSSRTTGAIQSVNMALVDGSGNQITSFGGGTQYSDGASVATPTGTSVMWNDAGVQRNVSAAKPLPVNFTNSSLAVTGTFWQATQPISASSLPLPTGAATETTLSALNTKVTAVNTGAVTISTALPAGSNVIGGVTQSGTWSVRNQDGSGNNLASSTTTPAGTEQALIVRNIPSGTQTISGTVTANLGTLNGVATETTLSALNTKIPASPAQDRTTAASPSAIRLSDGSAFYKATTPSDTQPISASSLPLPTGASTSALQTTGNSSLSSIDSKTPALGQALAAASVPVVLTAAQISTLTPPAAITGFALETTLSSLNAKVTAVNTGAVVISSGNITISNSSFASTQSGNWSVRNQDGSGNAITSRATGSARPIDVAIVDASGNHLTSFGGGSGTEYAEGTTSATPTGQVMLWKAASDVLQSVSASNPLPITASSLPLPTGAATQATLSALNTKVSSRTTGAVQSINVAIVDGSGNHITSFSGGEGGGGGATEETLGYLKSLMHILKPLQIVTGSGSNRLSLDVNAVTTLPTLAAVTTVTTVTTVSSVTNIAQMGGVNAFQMMKDISLNTFNNSVRSRL